MKIGIITYESLYCNFTNYGTVLQAWALLKVVSCLNSVYEPVLIDYCPDIMRDKDPFNPMKNMWDMDYETRNMCEMSLPSIKINFEKIRKFYFENIRMSNRSYTSATINKVVDEGISKFICGSDSIWDITEFGLERAFFADYPVMRGNSIAYAPSFQDSFSEYSLEERKRLIKLLDNFFAVGVRDEEPLDVLCAQMKDEVKRVVDPTLLLKSSDFNEIIADKQESERYLLYYSRRYNETMEKFVVETAKARDLKVIEISLRHVNCERHRMFYEAGIEEFLSLVKYAECVVTNSFHCLIFALHFEKDFFAFTREHCNKKISELLARLDLGDRLLKSGYEEIRSKINYSDVKKRLDKERSESLGFLDRQLKAVCGE